MSVQRFDASNVKLNQLLLIDDGINRQWYEVEVIELTDEGAILMPQHQGAQDEFFLDFPFYGFSFS